MRALRDVLRSDFRIGAALGASAARVATLLVDLGFGLLVGVSVAWLSGRLLAQSTLLGSASLWALIAYEAIVAGPIAAFLSMHFPMWRVLNLWPASPRGALILTIVGPLAAVTAFVATRRTMLAGKRRRGVWLALTGSAMLVTATLLFMFAKKAQPAAIESGRSLGHLAIGGAVLCVIAWLTMLWRIKLLASSERTASGTVTHLPPQARDGRTKPLEVARKSSGKR